MSNPSPQPDAWDKKAGLSCALCCFLLAVLAVLSLIFSPAGTGMIISTSVLALLFLAASVGYLVRCVLTIRALYVLAILVFACELIARFQAGPKVLQFGVLPWLLLTVTIWQNGRLESHIKKTKQLSPKEAQDSQQSPDF